VDETALKLTYEHLGFKKFSWGDIPESPWEGRDRTGEVRGGEWGDGREVSNGNPPLSNSGYAAAKQSLKKLTISTLEIT
jgi:hypothetical protein